MRIFERFFKRNPIQAFDEQLVYSNWAMREIFNATSEGLVVNDGETGEILAVNRRMIEIFGYTESEFKELGPAVISTPAKLEEALTYIRKTVTEGPQPLYERETFDS